MALFQHSVLNTYLSGIDEQTIELTTLPEEAEWMETFNRQKARADELKSQIEQTDTEINGMVYGLYGLSEEEIGVVEGS